MRNCATFLVEQILGDQSIVGRLILRVQTGDLARTEGTIPDPYFGQATLEKAVQVAGAHAQRCRTVLRTDPQVLGILLTGAVPVPLVLVTALEDPVPVNRRLAVIRHAHNVDPLSRRQWLLKVAADAQAATWVEHVETDAVGSVLRITQAVHAEGPLLLTSFALAEPVDVSRSFGAGERERIWSNPGRYGQRPCGRHAEVRAVRNIDVARSAVELCKAGWCCGWCGLRRPKNGQRQQATQRKHSQRAHTLVHWLHVQLIEPEIAGPEYGTPAPEGACRFVKVKVPDPSALTLT